jgi:hypothetical protein
LAIAIGVLLDAVARALAQNRPWISPIARAAFAVAFLAALTGSVAMVGAQNAFRWRSEADARLATELRRVVPQPPPDTLFVVLEDARVPGRTGAAVFDGMLVSPLALPQSATPYLRWAYRRADLFAAQPTSWGSVELAEMGSAGARLRGLEPAYPWPWPTSPAGGVLVPWDKLVPLRIAADGRVALESSMMKRDLGVEPTSHAREHHVEHARGSSWR